MPYSITDLSKAWYAYPAKDGVLYRVQTRLAYAPFTGLPVVDETLPTLPDGWRAQFVELYASDNAGKRIVRRIPCSDEAILTITANGGIFAPDSLDGIEWFLYLVRAERNYLRY